MTLVEFLLARIAEDEAVTRRQIESNIEGRESWEGDDPLEGCTPQQRAIIEAEIAEDEANGPYFAEAVTAERYLLECEAKRRIIELADDATGLDCQVDSEWRVGSRDEATEPYCGDAILVALALPYADHPDYRAEWRP